MMYLALYKGKGKPGNYLTRWWTGSQYSHCELVIDGMCYSASFMDGGVRCKLIDLAEARWDVVPITGGNAEAAVEFFNQTKGRRYDWLGLFGAQLFNRGIQNPRRYFCSEWCAKALNVPHPERHTPHTLAALIHFLNKGGLHGTA